ncbi:MAG TPA: hypothetical protein VE977_11420 [Pyrinomonadaceae bacterium]|nr:hypothetical protein [Pyrinomonadaceae bacterium]
MIDISERESFNEPAKLAERVIAPGDGEAEPGVTASNFGEPAKLAKDGSRGIERPSVQSFLHVASVAHFVGSDAFWVRFPRLGFAIAWG